MATEKTEKPTEQNERKDVAPERENDTKTPRETRWVKNAFFEGGSTKYIRLDEVHNFLNDNNFGEGDTTDEELAAEILRRAGLVEHVRYEELKEGLTDFFSTIPSPAMEWINPNYGKHYPKNIQPR